MAAFADFSSNPANVTTIAGLSVAENTTSMAAVNNCLRELAAQGNQLYVIVSGIANPMPLSGGAFTGDITRSGRGAYIHWNSSSQASGKIFIQPSGGAAPTMANGDLLFEY